MLIAHFRDFNLVSRSPKGFNKVHASALDMCLMHLPRLLILGVCPDDVAQKEDSICERVAGTAGEDKAIYGNFAESAGSRQAFQGLK